MISTSELGSGGKGIDDLNGKFWYKCTFVSTYSSLALPVYTTLRRNSFTSLMLFSVRNLFAKRDASNFSQSAPS